VSVKYLAIMIFTAGAFAQAPLADGVGVYGEVQGASSSQLSRLYVELYGSENPGQVERAPLGLDGSFHFDNVPPGNYRVRVMGEPGGDPVMEEFHQLDGFNAPLRLDLPSRPAAKPISATVSLWDLQHPVPKKALRDFNQARKYSHARESAKAIAKLEEAVRIAPDFRDAHINLGVQYARTRRYAEAAAQFETAGKLGPPKAVVYSNLAWVQAAQHQIPEAVASARQALRLAPETAQARQLLELLHAREK
jgi:tetratricopeptide (TPR) repeat protein